MKTFLKALKASNFKERNQTKTDIQDFRNIKTFETFQRYVSLLFPVFSNFWVLLYYYFDLQKLEFAGHIHTYIYVYVIYIYYTYYIYIIYVLYILYILYIIYYIYAFWFFWILLAILHLHSFCLQFRVHIL